MQRLYRGFVAKLVRTTAPIVNGPFPPVCAPSRVGLENRLHLHLGGLRSNVQITSSRSNYVQIELEIASKQRETQELFRNGVFDQALETATECKELVLQHFGKKHPVLASCLNNIALMQKSMERYDDSIETYQEALHVYKECIGEKHASYATTLNNLGLVYRTMAHQASALERMALYERSKECFQHALEIRQEVLEHGQHPDIPMGKCNLGSAYWHLGDGAQAEKFLLEALSEMESIVGANHVMVATIQNNLGFMYKGQEKYDQAIACYECALEIREQVLGASHPECIITRNNLAEAYYSSGQEDKAVAMQQSILDILEHKENE